MPEIELAVDDDSAGGLALQVRNVLAHLYDPAYLQNHPLAEMLPQQEASGGVTRAQALRRLLLDCLDRLAPEASSGEAPEAARAYAILTYRYIDGLSTEVIAAKLALSRRQTYREHGRGIEAIASMLQQMGAAQGSSAEVPGRLDAAREEVRRLRGVAHPKALSLAEVMSGVVRTVDPVMRQREIRPVVTQAADVPQVLADRGMARQALLNLFGLAIEAGVLGSLSVRLLSNGASVCVEIDGRRQPDRASPPASVNSGRDVDFTVTRALIDAQGGSLEVDAAGVRWTARMLLPTAEKLTLLVIDDNTDLISLLRRYLAGYDAIVVGASDGESALRLARDLRPRLIVLDIMMPDLDGWEVLQRLRALPETRDVPIIVCSVLHQTQMALAMGASTYLTKPISQREFLRALRQHLPGLRLTAP